MIPGDQERTSGLLLRALAGVHCGVLGGAAMLVWFGATSLLERQPLWLVPNLLGAFLHRDALRHGFGATTMAGAALVFCMAGAVGLLFGVLMGGAGSRRRTALLGILASLIWYYFSVVYFRNRLGMLATIYIPARSFLLAYLIYGFALARYAWVLDSLNARCRAGAGAVAGTPGG